MQNPLVDFNGHDTPDGHKYWTNPKTKEATWHASPAAPPGRTDILNNRCTSSHCWSADHLLRAS